MFENTDPESDNCIRTIKEEEDCNLCADDCVEPIPEEERQDSKSKRELNTRQKRSSSRKKPRANAWSSQKKELIKDEKAVVKLYEQEPFENPALERCRQNALNAKLNREKKKVAREQMEREVARLRSENARLRSENARLRGAVAAADRGQQKQRLRAHLRQ